MMKALKKHVVATSSSAGLKVLCPNSPAPHDFAHCLAKTACSAISGSLLCCWLFRVFFRPGFSVRNIKSVSSGRPGHRRPVLVQFVQAGFCSSHCSPYQSCTCMRLAAVASIGRYVCRTHLDPSSLASLAGSRRPAEIDL